MWRLLGIVTAMETDRGRQPHSAQDYAAFAVEAVRDAEHADGSDVRLEFLARAQAYALIAIAVLLAQSLRDSPDWPVRR